MPLTALIGVLCFLPQHSVFQGQHSYCTCFRMPEHSGQLMPDILAQAFNAIALGMKRVSSASSGRGGVENGDVVVAPRPQALRSSKRDRGQPEHYDPTQNGRLMQLTASQQRPPVCSPSPSHPRSLDQSTAHQQNEMCN